MEVQLHLRDEVKGMVDVPMIIVANKSDIVGAEGYMMMSTKTGDGIDAVLAEILLRKPEPVDKKMVVDIRSPIRHEEEEMDDEDDDYEKVKKPKRKRTVRKPRTVRAGMTPESI